MDREDQQACFRCSVPAEGAGYFIDGPHDFGVCGECVGYLMSVVAIDDVAMFERHAETARLYAENNERVRQGKPLVSGGLRRLIDGQEADLTEAPRVTSKKLN